MHRYFLGAVVGAALVGIGFAVAPASASGGAKTEPEPYQAAHPWAQQLQEPVNQTQTFTLNVPDTDRLVITDAFGYGGEDGNVYISGTLNGTAVQYPLESPPESGYKEMTAVDFYVDGSSSVTTTCDGTCNVTLSGYLVPLS